MSQEDTTQSRFDELYTLYQNEKYYELVNLVHNRDGYSISKIAEMAGVRYITIQKLIIGQTEFIRNKTRKALLIMILGLYADVTHTVIEKRIIERETSNNRKNYFYKYPLEEISPRDNSKDLIDFSLNKRTEEPEVEEGSEVKEMIQRMREAGKSLDEAMSPDAKSRTIEEQEESQYEDEEEWEEGVDLESQLRVEEALVTFTKAIDEVHLGIKEIKLFTKNNSEQSELTRKHTQSVIDHLRLGIRDKFEDVLSKVGDNTSTVRNSVKELQKTLQERDEWFIKTGYGLLITGLAVHTIVMSIIFAILLYVIR